MDGQHPKQSKVLNWIKRLSRPQKKKIDQLLRKQQQKKKRRRKEKPRAHSAKDSRTSHCIPASFDRIPNIPLKQYFGMLYRLVRTKHLEIYLQKYGVGYVKRKIAMRLIPAYFVLDYISGSYRMQSYSKVIHLELKFNLNEELEVKILDALFVLVFSFRSPNALVEVQRSERFVNVIERIFTKDHLEMTLTLDSCQCKLFYKRSFSREALKAPGGPRTSLTGGSIVHEP